MHDTRAAHAQQAPVHQAHVHQAHTACIRAHSMHTRAQHAHVRSQSTPDLADVAPDHLAAHPRPRPQRRHHARVADVRLRGFAGGRMGACRCARVRTGAILRVCCYVCTHAHTHTRTDTCMYSTCMYVHIFSHVQVRLRVACAWVHIHMRKCACMHCCGYMKRCTSGPCCGCINYKMKTAFELLLLRFESGGVFFCGQGAL